MSSINSKEESKLPPLSAAEFRAYNHMADHMDLFHNHFRATWTTLATAVEQNKRPKSMSIRQFLNLGLEFVSHLTMHHSIEEVHIFPHLATRMPEFQPHAHLITQHEVIHDGLDKFEAYLNKCRSGEEELRLQKLGELMGLGEEVAKEGKENWGKTLWTHLDDEVRTLGAENMRKYWSIEEMRRMPM